MGTKLSTGKKVVGGFALGLAILGVIGRVSYRSTRWLVQLSWDSNHAHQVFEQLQNVSSELQDAETGQRGYVITGDERYLEPYQSALQAIDQSLGDLRKSTADSPNLQRQIDTFDALALQKLAQLKETVDTRRQEGFERAANLIKSGQEKRTMDAIRKSMEEMNSEQAALIRQRTLDMQNTAQRTTDFIVFGSLLGFVVLGLATLVVIRDLTHRQRAEEALRGSEQRLSVALESAQTGIWELDLATDTSIRSLLHDQIFGYAHILPRWGIEIFMSHVVPKDRDSAKKSFEEALQADRLNLRCRIIRADDQSLRWISVQGRVLKNDKGEPIKMYGVVADVTDRKKAEEEMQALNRELQQRTVELTSVNKELEAFSYSVSHDLRAPLRSIDGFSQALLEDYHDKVDESGKDFLQRVRAGTQRMAQLIDDLINLSRVTRSEVRLEQVNLSGLARSLAEELRASEPGRQVEFSIADDLVAEGDEHLLRLAMDNLIRNAWKFTSKHPTARIEVGALGREDGRQIYFVRDDGAGFEMDHAQKLFSPFRRLHSMAEFTGTGVGLATVQRIIHRHGGRVWAEGQVDKGASFYFSL